ncbi:DUF4118 domain-containing protein [Gemmobacter sp.]|uniref:DUF4118 domain-containing protein n=1 Tax=Gemmobacter sp. TaxID=1898957 RepID=UPI0025BCF90E|nr:DUF4118 domain-containing protein [Gemmobacter sp.]
MAAEGHKTRPLAPPVLLRGPTLSGGLIAGVLVGLAALVVWWLQALLPDTTPPLIFLIAVLVSAARSGFWTGLATAAAAFLVMNFLFTEPVFTLHVAQPHDIVTLAVFLAVAGLVGSLAGRLRDRAEAARAQAETLAVLAGAAAQLAEADSRADLLARAVRALADLAQGQAVLVDLPHLPHVLAAHPPLTELSAADAQGAERCLRSGRAQPAAAEGWPGASQDYLIVPQGGAALAFGHARLMGHDTAQRAIAIATLAEQVALALRRLEASTQEALARQEAEREATRAALLTSLSHDLRTPLATILGAATTLNELHDGLPPAARTDLLAAIAEEADRLNSHVTNLLQMTRLSREIVLRRDWVDLNDIASAALTRARRAHPAVPCLTNLADLPMVRAEAGLLEQAVFNLIENAMKHGLPPVRMTSRQSGQTLTLTIGDAGPGPSAQVRDWLKAAPMWPMPEQRGLGLAVAKGIARVHDGQLHWAEGAFCLSLPAGERP